MQPALMFLYVVLFTTATGSFTSMACKPSCDNPEIKKEVVVEPAAKKNVAPGNEPPANSFFKIFVTYFYYIRT